MPLLLVSPASVLRVRLHALPTDRGTARPRRFRSRGPRPGAQPSQPSDAQGHLGVGPTSRDPPDARTVDCLFGDGLGWVPRTEKGRQAGGVGKAYSISSYTCTVSNT